MPIALRGPCFACCSRKNRSTSPSVLVGDVVGKRTSARMSSGPVPTTHTNLVPPASMPPKSTLASPCSRLPRARFERVDAKRVGEPSAAREGFDRVEGLRRVDAVRYDGLAVVREHLEGGPVEEHAEADPTFPPPHRTR